MTSSNPKTSKRKLDEITESIDLTLITEKTRIVEAEQGFDFLGFRLVWQYSIWRRKRVTKRFPSPIPGEKMRNRILHIMNNNAPATTTPEDA
ncbi:MAG: hypothetical protein QXW75_01390 [Thermoplasmatales archaeon]